MLKHLAPDQSLDSARRAAIEALLTFDADSDQRLDASEFAALLRRRGGAAAAAAAPPAAAALEPPCPF